jgi:hypothetical protein
MVAMVLVGFVLLSTGVILRRTYGITQAHALRELDRRLLQLRAEKAALEGDIRDLSSRARLAPIAEQRLHMHVPSDTQVIFLPVPTPGARP